MKNKYKLLIVLGVVLYIIFIGAIVYSHAQDRSFNSLESYRKDRMYYLSNDSTEVIYRILDKPLGKLEQITSDSIQFTLLTDSYSIFIRRGHIQFWVVRKPGYTGYLGYSILSMVATIRKLNYYSPTNDVVYIKK